ncbi:MAG: phosphopantetheine-binding protein, partial [Planctomycetota bacterium]
TGRSSVEPSLLANFLRQHLPSYMIPARYVLVEEFPKTINGKIDRERLPRAETGSVARNSDYVAPRSALEQRLVALWQDVLNVPEVGIHDDFFFLGGSSLLVAQVVAELTRDLDLELPVRDFFANPTVATSARQIEHLLGRQQGEGRDSVAADSGDSRVYRSRLPKIDAGFFPSDGRSLYRVHHPPVRESLGRAVLICQPYGHEYARAYRNLQQLSVQLAQHGVHVLRFDYTGTGQSELSCHEANGSLWLDDVRHAAEHLRELSQVNEIDVLGVRLGAMLAANATLGSVNQVAFWDPLTSGESFLKLLDGFHENMLTNLSVFRVVRRRGMLDQAFGHEWTSAKRRSIAELRFNGQPCFKAKRMTLYLSAGYQENEQGIDSINGWSTKTLTDEVRWHEPTYTESAISTPTLNQQIVSEFTGVVS